jgi:hypothetical protein
MSKESGRSRIWIWVALIVVLPIGGSLLLDFVRVNGARARALLVKPGDSKASVRRVLGEPIREFPKRDSFGAALIGLRAKDPEAWAYGSNFDWGNCFIGEFPYFFPFQIRLFGPDKDDVVIEFDDNERVTNVRVPGSG